MQSFIPPAQLRPRMASTGIGYAGIDGAWWLPALEPFRLPRSAAHELQEIAQAIFLLFDAVLALYGTDAGEVAGLDRVLEQRVAVDLQRWRMTGPVLAVRPDFQLQVSADGAHAHFVATELEISPSAQGFAHAMQLGYGLPTDLADRMTALTSGHPLIFAGAVQWSEFLFEQLAFCRAITERGGCAYVLYDQPLVQLAAAVQAGERWAPPIFGVPMRPPDWDVDLFARSDRHQLTPYLWPNDAQWPESVGAASVFRFGYVDTFEPTTLARLSQWQQQGATFLNPLHFLLDNKALLAAAALPIVRQWINARSTTAVATLVRALPETHLLQETLLPRLLAEQVDWIIKFAGFDRGNQAWGGRSLQIGARHTASAWRDRLTEALRLPWPVVAQRLTPSARVDIAYVDEHAQVGWLRQGATRLRSFFTRNPNDLADVQVGGTHLTVVADGLKVAESVAAVQAPVVF